MTFPNRAGICSGCVHLLPTLLPARQFWEQALYPEDSTRTASESHQHCSWARLIPSLTLSQEFPLTAFLLTFKDKYSAVGNGPSDWKYEQLNFTKMLVFNTANASFQPNQQEPCGPNLPFFPTTPSSAWLTPRRSLLSWAQFRFQSTFTALRRLHSAVQIVRVFPTFLGYCCWPWLVC